MNHRKVLKSKLGTKSKWWTTFCCATFNRKYLNGFKRSKFFLNKNLKINNINQLKKSATKNPSLTISKNLEPKAKRALTALKTYCKMILTITCNHWITINYPQSTKEYLIKVSSEISPQFINK